MHPHTQHSPTWQCQEVLLTQLGVPGDDRVDQAEEYARDDEDGRLLIWLIWLVGYVGSCGGRRARTQYAGAVSASSSLSSVSHSPMGGEHTLGWYSVHHACTVSRSWPTERATPARKQKAAMKHIWPPMT